jgi:hypothetical protein
MRFHSHRCNTKLLYLVPLILAGGLIIAGPASDGVSSTRTPLGRLAPKQSSAISSSPWGIQAGALDNTTMARAAAIGVKWTRLMASWREIEREKGVYSWGNTDEAFKAALEHGITPFVCLAASNQLYCAEGSKADRRIVEIMGSNPLPPTKDPEALKAWLRFVQSTVQRYKERIHYWEVWNEPNHSLYWGAEPDGNEYGMLLRETAREIKAVDPSAKVLGGAMAGIDPDFADKFLAQGTVPLIDIITFHHYSNTPEERIYKAVQLWEIINKYKPSLELWQGECGFPSHSSTRDFRGTSPWGVTIQAKWLLRQSFTDVFFCRATLSNYFKLVHEGGRGEKPNRSFLTPLDSVLGFPERGGSRVKSVGVNEKCILENPTLNPKPAYFAYQHLCALFDNRYNPVTAKTTIAVHDAGGFYGVGEEDDAFPSRPLVTTFGTTNGRHLVAYWLPWHPQETVREGRVDLVAGTLAFTDPVLIDLLTGDVFPVKNMTREGGVTTFHDVPLSDYPFVIAEKSEVPLEP